MGTRRLLGRLFVSIRQDVHIERMAIVGERQWEELALLFTAQGLRTFPIQYFGPAQSRDSAGMARR